MAFVRYIDKPIEGFCWCLVIRKIGFTFPPKSINAACRCSSFETWNFSINSLNCSLHWTGFILFSKQYSAIFLHWCPNSMTPDINRIFSLFVNFDSPTVSLFSSVDYFPFWHLVPQTSLAGLACYLIAWNYLGCLPTSTFSHGLNAFVALFANKFPSSFVNCGTNYSLGAACWQLKSKSSCLAYIDTSGLLSEFASIFCVSF